jgi:hypothetical protein
MAERPFFVLRGVIPTDAGAPGPSGGGGVLQRKGNSSGRVKLLDDHHAEQLHLERCTVLVPTFAMITQEGVLYPESVQDRLCQWDHYPIQHRPVGMPSRRFLVGKRRFFVCCRWFCSLECARSHYKLLHAKDPQYAHTLRFLDEMNRLLLEHLGAPYAPLEDARDPNLLKLVGSGTMDIDDFRAPWGHKYARELGFVMFRGVEAYVKRLQKGM